MPDETIIRFESRLKVCERIGFERLRLRRYIEVGFATPVGWDGVMERYPIGIVLHRSFDSAFHLELDMGVFADMTEVTGKFAINLASFDRALSGHNTVHLIVSDAFEQFFNRYSAMSFVLLDQELKSEYHVEITVDCPGVRGSITVPWRKLVNYFERC